MLTTKRPTPTTVLYTISTRAPSPALPSLLLTTLSTLLRLAAGYLILTTLLYDYTTRPTLPRIRLLDALSATVLRTNPALPVLHASPAPSRLVAAVATAFLALMRFHTTESLLVIRGLGVQTSTSSPSYVGTARTRFIPTSSIQDIFIHEAFKGFEVRFYLSIVVEGEEGVVVVFPKTLPRREVLDEVWRGARACLYEPKT